MNFLAAVLYFLASSAASAPAHFSFAATTLSRTASGVCSACACELPSTSGELQPQRLLTRCTAYLAAP